MKTKHFIKQLDHPAIVAAIQSAEVSTSGQIRVFVSHQAIDDAIESAKERFAKLGIHETPHHNGILIFVAPEARKFAVIGDTAIHEKCGDGFWPRIAEILAEHFKKEDFTAGIIAAIKALAIPLAEHFPRSARDSNTLPDEVEEES